MKASVLLAVLAFAAGPALAAPCNTDAAKAKTPNDQAANPQSSDVDKSSKNLAGGQQPASAGTVGAMNNVSPTGTAGIGPQGSGEKKDGAKEDPGAKNLAGGQQPASPGTVGAMNNAAPTGQNTGQQTKDDNC